MVIAPSRLISCHAGLARCLALLVTCCPSADSADLAEQAAGCRQLVSDKFLPYWFDTTIDREHGGYLLADDAVAGRSRPREKQLVSQAREVWAFSLAHRMGFSTPQRDYLEAATHGLRFLRERMRDAGHGGYFWSVEVDGRLRDPHKIIYGQAFVIYALVEYHRAGGGRQALDDALALYREIQLHAHDRDHGGWTEHFERDWTPLAPRDPKAIVEVAGYKSANTHLHLMEALTELYSETRDPAVRDSLSEALDLNRKYFYPPDASRAAFHFQPDWAAVTDPRSAGLSYGHNIEFAWLMIRAEETLGRAPSWDHFFNHLDHTLRHGTDHQRGGIYESGSGDQPADDTDKVWWVQAEGLAALTDALRRSPLKDQAGEAGTRARAPYVLALRNLLAFTKARMSDPETGVWLDTVAADGTPKGTGLAHAWKANYHDLRAFLKFVEAFDKIRIVLVGDSTVNDGGGWGAGFKPLLDDRVECANHALNGRSSKSFIGEGHWKMALAGGADYVLIQFGHNDMPGKGPDRETDPATTYQEWLGRYVADSRAAGAVPVLVTPMTRRNFRDGRVASRLGDYAQAVRDLARRSKVPLIDLHARSIELLNRLGPAESDTLGPVVDDRPDRTHLSPKGQAVMAALVAGELRTAVPELAPHLKPAASPGRQPGAANPILPGYFADPSIVRHQGKFFLYATLDPWGGETLGCWESADFRQWTYRTLNWPTRAACTSPTSGSAAVWAPSVVLGPDRKFHMFISVGNEVWTGLADHPLGPWRDANAGKPLIPREFKPGFHMIDAEAFVDDDGTPWLYWGSGWNWTNGKCWAVRLRPDMAGFDGEVHDVTPTNYFEGPVMVKRGGRYFLMYSQGVTVKDDYQVHYAVGDKPLGPFVEAPNSPILVTSKADNIISPGHHTVFRFEDRDYILYHRHGIPFTPDVIGRQICVDELSFTPGGAIRKLAPSHQGPLLARGRDTGRGRLAATATASAAANPDCAAGFAIDDNYATRWSLPAAGQDGWLQLDLGKPVAFSSQEIRFEYAWKPYFFLLQASDDGTSWQTLADHTANPATGSPVIIGSSASARFLRLHFPAREAGGPPSVFEWEVLAKPRNNPTPSD